VTMIVVMVMATKSSIKVKPLLDWEARGVFMEFLKISCISAAPRDYG
jgi:hypothetical protein